MRIDALALPAAGATAPESAERRVSSTPFAAVLGALKNRAPDVAKASPPADAISEEFKAGVAKMAGRLKMNPAHLVAAMWFESRMNPAASNGTTRAVGLIQFMPGVAADLLDLPKPTPPARPTRTLGSADLRAYLQELRVHQGRLRDREREAVQRMAAMTREQQLPYVEKYFAAVNHGRPMASLVDTYMGMLWPSAIGKGNDSLVARADSEGFERLVYAQNAALDANKDGRITAGEAAALVAGASYAPKVRALIADVERYARGLR